MAIPDVIHVPLIRQTSAFLQRVLRVMGAGEFFWATKLEVCCRCCTSAGSLTPIQGRVPTACRAAVLLRVSAAANPGVWCTPGGRRRLLALHHDPSALARALPVQREVGFDVSTLLLLCYLGITATPPRTAFHSIILKHFFIDFDAGHRSTKGACHPFIVEELMKDGESLSTALGTNSDLPHRSREGCNFSLTEC